MNTQKNYVDYTKIKLMPASLDDYPVIQNLGRFYAYDMSEYLGYEAGWEMPEDGLYECIDLKKYWELEDSYPFLVRYENELAGFVIIDKKGSDPSVNFNVAQFFVLRKFKRKGIGRYVAEKCFDKFRGTWEVMVMPGNDGAYRFWQATIKKYCGNNFTEYTREVAHLKNNPKNIFKFSNE
jgi:ribosomal-protein-alanine N-acetyltransferase